jgi:RNA polymerase sigma-70 factor (ECF subfamily)
VQEASLRAFRHFDQFRGDDAHSWLLTIVRHTCYSWHRRQRRRPSVSQVAPLDVEDPDAPCPERLLLQRLTTRRVTEAIATLPESFRQVFILRELEGLGYRAIADTLHMPVGTVMSRLSRAREQLRRALRPREIAYSDPSARLTLTKRSAPSRVIRSSQGLQQTSQSCTSAPYTSLSMYTVTSSPQ